MKNDPKGKFLSGSVLEGWYAKNLRDQDTGLSSWAEDEIVTFLKTGRTDRTAAFGSMADVVQHSTQYLAEDDLRAIARYLKSLPPSEGREREWQPKEDVTAEALKAEISVHRALCPMSSNVRSAIVWTVRAHRASIRRLLAIRLSLPMIQARSFRSL